MTKSSIILHTDENTFHFLLTSELVLVFSMLKLALEWILKDYVYHIQENKLTAIYHMEYYSFLLLPLENMNIRKRFARQWFFMRKPEVKTLCHNFFFPDYTYILSEKRILGYTSRL